MSVLGRDPASDPRGAQSSPDAEIHHPFFFSRKWWEPIYPMLLSGFPGGAIVGISFFGCSIPFSAPSESFCESARRVWRSWRFLPSASHPRCHHCAGPEPAFVRCVLVSNRISIRMSAAVSLQLQLSILKLIRPTSLSTTPLSPSRCCPSLLSPSSRLLPSLSSSV